MPIFIGGDTASVNMDFGLKVANSTAECPMKLYKGAIDVNAAPSPFTYPQQISDFSGKISGSTVENPNKFGRQVNSVLVNPSTLVENSQSDYNNIMALDNVCYQYNTSTNGYIAQQIFSFSLIEIFQRAYGTIPGTTDTASRVAWLKANINLISLNYYGYGSGQNGNLIKVGFYTTSWQITGNGIRNYSTVNNINLNFLSTDFVPSLVQSDGYVHFIAYSDPSNGTIASVVNTDMISLTINYKDQSSIVWWKEETSQSVLDKLKAQNEIPITSVDTTNRTGIINGKTVVLQSDTQPAVRDDFLGKITGSVTENPNISYLCSMSSLQSPSNITGNHPTGWQELTQLRYDSIKSLSDVDNWTVSTIGGTAQRLYSFNIIEMLERKFGSLPCNNDLASKIAYAKANISKIATSWTGYGVGPLGNKAYLDCYTFGSNTWTLKGISNSSIASNTSSSPTIVNYSESRNSVLQYLIDSNGYIHFLAYADAARTTDSTLLVLSGHGMNTSNYGAIYNVTKSAWGVTDKNIGTVNVITLLSSKQVTGQIGGDVIKKYNFYSAVNSETGTTTTTLKITNHGLSTGDAINVTKGDYITTVTVVDANTLTLDNSISQLLVGDQIRLMRYIGTQTAESTIISSTIYTDYISLDIQLKPTAPGYDLLVPSNPRRDSVTNGNYDNCILAEKVYNSLTSDYTGKIAGSVAENPNKFYFSYTNSLQSPSNITGNYSTGFAEETGQTYIDKVKTLDSTTYMKSINSSGFIAQTLFQFPLISIFEKTYGTINAATLQGKIDWLKSNISNIQIDWTGYGSCPSGNKAYLDVWRNDINDWGLKNGGVSSVYSNATSSPSVISGGIAEGNNIFKISRCIDTNGLISVISYAPASDGNTASTIFTDYIKLTITFSNGNNALEYFTNNSVEIATQTTSKATSYLIEADLSPICTALFGGSNAALKAALKAIQTDIYASGYGASSNDVTNGVAVKTWSDTYVSYGASLSKSYIYSYSNFISKCSLSDNSNDKITSSNKIYILVTSTNNSTVDVPSVVSLDYCTIRVDLSRINDVVTAIPITL